VTGTESSEKPNATADKDSVKASENPPEELVAEAKAAFGRRTGGELASLVLDTLIDQDDPASEHRLRFEHPGLAIDLQVSVAATGSTLTGTVQPPTPMQVQLEFNANPTRQDVDASEGAFAFDRIPHGIIRLHIAPRSDLPPIHTDWFRI
jgi:hypothetical protein